VQLLFFTPYSSRTCTRTVPCSRNLESIFRPRLLFGNRQGVQLMNSYRINVRTALSISSLPPFSMNRVPCSIYSYPLPTVPEFLLQCCTPTRRSQDLHSKSAHSSPTPDLNISKHGGSSARLQNRTAVETVRRSSFPVPQPPLVFTCLYYHWTLFFLQI
jgi:hypothetical protein